MASPGAFHYTRYITTMGERDESMETVVADVLVNIAARRVEKPFTYAVPLALREEVQRGCRVLVPFGARLEEGFVWQVRSCPQEEESNWKEINACLDLVPWFDEAALSTAQWLSRYYLCTLAEALRLFVPGKRSVRTERIYCAGEAEPEGFSLEELALWNLFKERSSWTEKGFCQQAGEDGVRILRRWCRQGLAESYWQGRRRTQEKTESLWLAQELSAEERETALRGLERKKAQAAALQWLWEHPFIQRSQLAQSGISLGVLKALTEAGLIRREERRVYRQDGYLSEGASELEPLNEAQQQAMAAIAEGLDGKESQEFLLFGVTGSGKTRVYLEAVRKVLRSNRQAIVLVPEIGLTGQLVRRFRAVLGEHQVVVWHSRLSEGERLDAWDRIHGGQAGVIIGARSAVFAPAHRLGLVILDEEHDGAYKQEERPRYHARDVARERCRQTGAVLLLGSATPSLETYERASSQEGMLLELPERATAAPLPQVAIVDMRQELKRGNRKILSRQLQAALDAALRQQEQAIILLNRRGYATFVMCRECGHTMECPHCSVSLVYHASAKILRCHYCDYQEHVPDVCPVCSSRYIRFFGSGTQKLEEELRRNWPEARIARMDQDTVGRKHAHEDILTAFRERRYDILLGTQMVAKGHDLPFVTAVGVIAADSSLHLPDFRAAERAFSLITQAAGRAGRREKAGNVVVQTYNPEHYAVAAAQQQDFPRFCQEERSFRKALGYPPFSRLISLTIAVEEELPAQRKAAQVADILKAELPKEAADIMGPCPAPLARIQNLFRMQLFLKCRQPEVVKEVLCRLSIEGDPQITIDVDPLHVL